MKLFKKLICCLLLLMLIHVSQAQVKNKGYEIVGNLVSIPDASMIYLNTGSYTDSTAVVNGKFLLKGEILEPQRSSFWLKHKNQVVNKYFTVKKDLYIFFLDNAKMYFTATDSLSNGVIKGSSLHEEYLSYAIGLSKIYDQLRPLNMKYYKYERENNVALMQQVRPLLDSLGAIEFSYVTSYVRENPKSPVSLFAVQQFAKPIATPPDYPAAFELLDKSLQETEIGKQLQKRMADENAFKVGDIMPEFSQPDTAGRIVHLSDFKGKYVLVDLWASWCGPCRMESPNIKRTFEKYDNKGFVVIMVSIDGTKGSWLTAIKQDGVQHFVQLGDMKDRKNAVAQLLKVRSIPQNFLIDRSGKIVGKNLHGDALEKKLEEILDAKKVNN